MNIVNDILHYYCSLEQFQNFVKFQIYNGDYICLFCIEQKIAYVSKFYKTDLNIVGQTHLISYIIKRR